MKRNESAEKSLSSSLPMSETPFPTLILPAFERPDCLKRLLRSLDAAVFPEKGVQLVFSLEGESDPEVVKIAQNFQWKYGEKIIIERESRLGLREHILACGDLTKEYGSVILLEDDLFVAPGFYEFARKALEFYQEETRVSGISLYSYRVSECRFFPFLPLDDGQEVYFQQFASSWGQAWTQSQWASFRDWFRENEEIKPKEKLPQYLREWSETSWKRHFIRYMLAEDKHFVFPRESYSTNFGDPGTNSDTPGLFQVPLQSKKSDFSFVPFYKSWSRYDVYFEPLPFILKNANLNLSEFEFTVDLYGQKDADFLDQPFVLTSRKGVNPEITFGLDMIPIEENVIHGVKGNEIRLLKTENLNPEFRPLHYYFYQYRSNQEFMYRDLIEAKADELAEVWAEERSEHKAIEKAYPIAEKLAEEKAKFLAEGIAEKMASERFVEWNENQDFGQKWPKLSVVIPELSSENEDWVKSLYEIPYPHLELVFVVNDEEKEEILDKKGRKTAKWLKAGDLQAWERLKTGLEACSGEFCGWLPPGGGYLDKGLKAFARIVRRFPEVAWLMGTHDLDKRPPVFRRWIRDRYLTEKADRLLDFRQAATMFWKREMMLAVLQNNQPKGLYDLFENFFENEYLYVYAHAIGKKSRVNAKYFGDKLVRKSEVSTGKKIWNTLFYPFYIMDMKPIRAFYPEANDIPDVIKYDSKSQDFYRSKY